MSLTPDRGEEFMSTSIDSSRDRARQLVRQVRSGSRLAWHHFVDEYSRLILSVIRRYLAFASEDDRRDLFVEILRRLKEGTLDRYDGRSALSTWLFIYSRSRALDWLRSARGRKAVPKWLLDLPARDQRVFRLYYVDGLGCSMVRQILAKEGLPTTLDEMVDSLERLDHKLDNGMRRRLAGDLFAQSVGQASGRLLAFLCRLRVEYEANGHAHEPEQELLRRELAHVAEQVRECVAQLPEIERRVIAMRYFEGRTARDASQNLGLRGQREVYTVEGRALRRLRTMIPE